MPSAREVVACGPGHTERLCHCVALIKGVGQLWHTLDDRYVVSRLTVRGEVEWSLVPDAEALLRHYDIPYTLLELPDNASQLG